jgi:hypothetical protein
MHFASVIFLQSTLRQQFFGSSFFFSWATAKGAAITNEARVRSIKSFFIESSSMHGNVTATPFGALAGAEE